MKTALRTILTAGSLLCIMMLPPLIASAHAAALDSQQFQIKEFPLLAQVSQENIPAPDEGQPRQQQTAPEEKKRTKHPILMYLPNRIFDLLDIFRLRVRVGPGISAGVRATKPVSAFVGFHSTLFVGLYGPRGKAEIPFPVGIESRGGAQASLANLAPGNTYYGPLEVGVEVQPLILGFNIGIEPFELLDFVAGFFFIDLQDDDF